MINQIVMLAVCLAIIALAVSSGSRGGSVGPRAVLAFLRCPAIEAIVAAMLAVGGIIFPLVGMSLIIVPIVDFVWTSLSGRRGRAKSMGA